MNLTLPLATPPWTLLGKQLEARFRKALFEYQMIENEEPIVVALSGGKDSLTLLYLLHAVRGRGLPDFPLYAVHISGRFSCGSGVSKDYLQNICSALQVPYYEKEAKMPDGDLECYSCSRQRRKLLFETAKELGSTKIAFGHHQDDSNQTLLMNLLHKAEFEPMEPKIYLEAFGVTLIRPLVYIEEEKIIRFAEKYGFKRITCKCPYGQNSQRKKTQSLLQQMEEVFPSAQKNLFSAGTLYRTKKALIPSKKRNV